MKGPLRVHRGGNTAVGKVIQGRLNPKNDRRFLGGKKLTAKEIDKLASQILQ